MDGRLKNCELGLILGMDITNNGILMTSDYQGRSSGEAYVQFSSKDDAEKALEKNKQCIGHRLVGREPGGGNPWAVAHPFCYIRT